MKRKVTLLRGTLLRGLTMYYLPSILRTVPVIIDPTLVSDENAEEIWYVQLWSKMAGWIKDDFEYAAANMSNTAPKGRYTSDYAKFLPDAALPE